MRFLTWAFIFLSLTLGAGAYWFSSREYEGKAAETINASKETVMTNTLVGYWTLDGNDIAWGDANEIKDVNPGTKHDGNVGGSLAAASAVPGRTGQGLLFNGTTDSISLGSVYNGVKTVAFWVKPNTTTQSLIDLNATATVDINAGTVRGNNFTTPTIYVDGVATTTFPDTEWHHIAVTTGTGINASAAYIGQIASSYFGGTIDDIRFYSDALTATQVADLYRASGAKEISNANHREALTSGLVGYWTMDGRDTKWSDANEIKDISGNGNHGNVAGSLATTSVVPGKLGQGMSFNGTSDYVNAGSASSLDNIAGQGGGGISVSFWIYPRDTSTYSGILHKTSGWALYLNQGTTGNVFFRYYLTSGEASKYTYQNSLVANTWQHVVATYTAGGLSGSSDVKIYINQTEPRVLGTGNGTGSISNDAAEFLSIGANGRYLQNFFNGLLDDIRIYNRVLSSSEISTLYYLGK